MDVGNGAGVAERINAFACKANVRGFDSLRRRVENEERYP